jgi:hypothetical protein
MLLMKKTPADTTTSSSLPEVTIVTRKAKPFSKILIAASINIYPQQNSIAKGSNIRPFFGMARNRMHLKLDGKFPWN